MVCKRFCFTVLLLVCAMVVQARFPFSFGKPTIRTDYSQTVLDQIMQQQALTDMRRGMGEMAVARYQDASNSFAKAVIKNTKDPLGYLLLGASLYWAGKVDDAVSEYNEALSRDPNNAMAYQLLGIAAGWKGDIRQAQTYFLQAARLDPNKADTHMNLGSTYAVLHDLDSALDHFRQAVELAPREPLFHYQLGMLYDRLGRDELAEASLKKALHYFSAYEDAQLSLGALYEKMENPSAALKYYKKAVKTKPGDYVARLRYAFLLLQQGDETTARRILEEAFSISRFKNEGLALNAVYRASGNAPQDFEKQIKQFQDMLSKVAPAKPVHVEVTLERIPEDVPTDSNHTSGNTFEREYQKMHGNVLSAGDKQIFQRVFTFPAADAKTRTEQLAQFAQGLRQSVAQTDAGLQVNLSLQGRTADYDSPRALTQQNNVPPKAVYDPHIVGNDMGLWVMGRTWLKFVDEAEEELQEYACPSAGNTCLLLQGLAVLARGGDAAPYFKQAAERVPADPLAQLGLGTAAVVADDIPAARKYYNAALQREASNKIAQRNLKILAEE